VGDVRVPQSFRHFLITLLGEVVTSVGSPTEQGTRAQAQLCFASSVFSGRPFVLWGLTLLICKMEIMTELSS
jgi:hypothetical protein